MRFFGWKRWGGPPGEPADFFTWSPRMEQLEFWASGEDLDRSWGVDDPDALAQLDRVGSVSGVTSDEGHIK